MNILQYQVIKIKFPSLLIVWKQDSKQPGVFFLNSNCLKMEMAYVEKEMNYAF